MKPKTMVLMVVAVGCGLVASYMTSRLIAERSAPEQKPTVKVLVAKKKIKAMTALNKPEDLLAEKEIPVELAPKKALTSFDNLKDKRVNKAINEDAFLTQDDLVTKETSTLDYELPPGYRAVGMQVNPVSLTGGFVLPRSRVDIIAVTREGEPEAKIILQDMLVLAVDMASDRDPDKGKGMLGSTVTLAALPEEATRLALASNMGELRLLLRRPEDHDKVTFRPSKRSDFGRPLTSGTGTGGPAGAEGTEAGSAAVKIPELPEVPTPSQPVVANTEPPPPEEPPAKTHTMKLVLGDSIQEVKFIQEKDGTWTKAAAKQDLDEPREPKPAKPQRGIPPAKAKEQDAAPAPAKKPETLQDKLLKNSGLPPVEAANK